MKDKPLRTGSFWSIAMHVFDDNNRPGNRDIDLKSFKRPGHEQFLCMVHHQISHKRAVLIKATTSSFHFTLECEVDISRYHFDRAQFPVIDIVTADFTLPGTSFQVAY